MPMNASITAVPFINAILLILFHIYVFYIGMRYFIYKFRKNFTLFQKTNCIYRDNRIASIFTAQNAFKSLRPVIVHLRIKQIILCDFRLMKYLTRARVEETSFLAFEISRKSIRTRTSRLFTQLFTLYRDTRSDALRFSPAVVFYRPCNIFR